MKENKYDDERFFQRYSQMPRSVRGLEAAGEWHTLEKMLPDFQGKRVLDLGCGFGWHCRYAALHGALSVTGIDLSNRMIARARRENSLPQITYRQIAIEDYEYPASAFDVVLSSLAFHYLASFDEICPLIARSLSPDGNFVFSVEHPVFTAQGPQDWHYDEKGSPLHWPVDRYFSQGARKAVFLGEKMIKYHRTITYYIDALLQNGFELTGLNEPQPPLHWIDTIPGMKDELRRPMILLISARKKA